MNVLATRSRKTTSSCLSPSSNYCSRPGSRRKLHGAFSPHASRAIVHGLRLVGKIILMNKLFVSGMLALGFVALARGTASAACGESGLNDLATQLRALSSAPLPADKAAALTRARQLDGIWSTSRERQPCPDDSPQMRIRDTADLLLVENWAAAMIAQSWAVPRHDTTDVHYGVCEPLYRLFERAALSSAWFANERLRRNDASRDERRPDRAQCFRL